MDKADIIQQACLADATGQDATARQLLQAHYPFQPLPKAKRSYTLRQSLAIFERDGFIDRYKGTRLIYPGALYLLLALLPEDFPAHRNWKMDGTHLAFWELCPTIDHVVPVACGGADDESNWYVLRCAPTRSRPTGGWRIWAGRCTRAAIPSNGMDCSRGFVKSSGNINLWLNSTLCYAAGRRIAP